MKRFVSTLMLCLSLAIVSAADNIQVLFSPKGGCTAAVVENLDKATNSVVVQANSFTSAPIAKALVVSASGRFVSEAKDVLFLGPPGVGKIWPCLFGWSGLEPPGQQEQLIPRNRRFAGSLCRAGAVG
jgi:hypothetical protein